MAEEYAAIRPVRAAVRPAVPEQVGGLGQGPWVELTAPPVCDAEDAAHSSVFHQGYSPTTRRTRYGLVWAG